MKTTVKKLKIFAILGTVLLAQFSFAQDKTTCAELGLKGKVKEIIETQYKLSDINPGLNEIVGTIFIFDRNFRKTSEIATEVDGEIKHKHVISYDKAGNIVSEIKRNAEMNADFNFKYKYDAQKRLSKKEMSSGGKLLSTYVYTYDSRGNVSLMEINKKLGLLDIFNEKFEYKYDSFNRLIEETHLDGKEYSRTEYKYDEKSRLIRKVEYNDRGGITYEFDYEYDAFDNMSTQISRYRGNQITNFSYVYEYDNQGNWINKRSLSNDLTFSLQIRIIKYY